MKEVPNQDVAGVTPLSSCRTDAPGKPGKKVLVHDGSLDPTEYKEYYNALNVGCKVINMGVWRCSLLLKAPMWLLRTS